MQMTLLLEILRTYAPLSLPRQSLQDVLVSVMGNRGAVLQVKVAVAPESVPRLGARAALEIPPISVEVHLGKADSRQARITLLRCLPSRLRDVPLRISPAARCIPGIGDQ